MQTQINLLVLAQFGEKFLHLPKLPRRENFFTLEPDEIQRNLDRAELLEVSVNFLAIEKRQLPVLKQNPQRIFGA